MRKKEISTVALQLVLRDYMLGYTHWVGFRADVEKVPVKASQWEMEFGTSLLPYQKQRRKRDGLPTAVATCMPSVGFPNHRQIILMATPLLQQAHPASPWHKQQWRQSPPEFWPYIMVREPRIRGDYAWTWRIQDSEFLKISARLTAIIKSGNAATVRTETEVWLRVFSMQGGVRRQFRKMLSSGRKLWVASHKSTWPGVDPDELPAIVQFRKESDSSHVSKRPHLVFDPLPDLAPDRNVEGP